MFFQFRRILPNPDLSLLTESFQERVTHMQKTLKKVDLFIG
jgi:hypothetical protein